ncbi:hypothetical protein FRB94_013888 [Tulasnella sp. JGI-2019a]|nr:hypothetical protein FRB94_013888 [Tulasnella sp. JGI-2019a]KAG9037990.1 hypothetical protein FRB95_003383 [Tulasnella sp. JGI-2019a]
MRTKCWSEEDITEVIPLTGRSLCHIELTSISAGNIDVLFQLFRQHCPGLRTVKLIIFEEDLDKRSYSTIMSPIFGLPVIESLQINMDMEGEGEIDADVLLSFAKPMMETCPMICRIKWKATLRPSTQSVVHMFDLVHGHWEVSSRNSRKPVAQREPVLPRRRRRSGISTRRSCAG